MNYFIQTFGCKVSQYESQAMREAWQKNIANSKEVLSPDMANVLVIASCAVTQEGVTDARQLCNKWRKSFPHAHIILTGCAAEVAKDDFVNANAIITQKSRDILLKNNPLDLNGYYNNANLSEFPDFSISDFKRSRPVIKVQDGCSHLCSYCIVPYTRGPSRSRSLTEILQEVDTLLQKGFREFVLSGVNLRQYDHSKLDFWDVLIALQENFAKDYENIARFRLSSLEPAQLNEKGIKALTLSNMVCPHLHLSLQSGSQTVLERMRREHYLISDVQKNLELLANKWQYFGLGADFLLGFPNESEAEFQETYKLVQELPFTYAHVFPYSIRPNTLAAKYPNQILKEVKKERTAKLRTLVAEKKKEFMQKVYASSSIPLLLSLDIPKQNNNFTEESYPLFIDGLDQFYTSCRININSLQSANSLLKHGHKLIPFNVENIHDDMLIGSSK